MKLSEENVELFYKLYYPLLVYVNKKFDILKGVNSPEDFKKFSIKEANKLRDKLYSDPNQIVSFVSENPWDFSSDELEIVNSWRNFLRGTFYIFRYLKDYTIFLEVEKTPKAYGVLGLSTTFEEMLGPYLPIMVETVLLPFKNKIIYDSILLSYPITFGGGIRRSLNDAYQEAKSRFGIIISLPFDIKKVEQSDTDKLRFYLRSERNRERYWEDIQRLINKDSCLLILYHQEMGKIHARTWGKRLREIGLTDTWFAILEGIIVASGKTKEQVEKIIREILPVEKKDWCYIFHLKKK